MTVFALKVIAMNIMVIDHLGYPFFFNNLTMRSIGRLAFIIYAFLIAEGYYHLRVKPERLKFHVIKIFILCLITEVPFDLFDSREWINFNTQSSLLTLMLGFLALIGSGAWADRFKKNRITALCGSVVICLTSAIISYLFKSEYKFAGVLLIVFFYRYLQKADNMNLPTRFLVLMVLVAVHICIYIWSRAGFGDWEAIRRAAQAFKPRLAGTLCSIIPIALYNRKLGYNSKLFSWLYSIFYPLQFIVLIIARYFIRGI